MQQQNESTIAPTPTTPLPAAADSSEKDTSSAWKIVQNQKFFKEPHTSQEVLESLDDHGVCDHEDLCELDNDELETYVASKLKPIQAKKFRGFMKM